MKTNEQKKHEEGLYKNRFLLQKAKSFIVIGVAISVIVGSIVSLVESVMEYPSPIGLRVIGMGSVITICLSLFSDFIYRNAISSKKEQLLQKIKEEEETLSYKKATMIATYKVIPPEKTIELNALQKDIWTLEFKLKMLGGTRPPKEKIKQ